MAYSYLHLLGQVFTATFATKESGDLAAALTKGGLSKDELARGSKLAHTAEELIRDKIDVIGEDRTREHAMHAASQEVEMWMQTVSFLVKKAVDEPNVVGLVLAKDLHAHDHGVTVVARALRMMSMMRCDDRVSKALGGSAKTREVLNRGHALTQKLFRASEIRLAPEGAEGQMQIFEDLEATRVELEAWVLHAASAAKVAAAKDARLVGRFGIVPEGVGIPCGGYSFAVVLHERGQTDAPDPLVVSDCPGWSAGRQGRNRENLGKGWLVSEA